MMMRLLPLTCVVGLLCGTCTASWVKRRPGEHSDQPPASLWDIGQEHPYLGGWNGKPPNHLDVSLPDSLLDSDASLLIHLKDQGLWNKENGVDGGNSKAALLPSYLKTSVSEKLLRDLESDPTLDEETSNHFVSPQELMHLLESQEAMGDLESIEQIMDDERFDKILRESDNGDGFHFNMKDIFNKIREEQADSENQHESSYVSKDMDGPGIHFNLADLEARMKQIIQQRDTSDDTDVNESPDSEPIPDGFFNFAENLKKYVDDKVNRATEEEEPNDKDNETSDIISHSTDEQNERDKMVSMMKTNNVTVTAVDKEGGIYFNVGKGHDDDEDSKEEV